MSQSNFNCCKNVTEQKRHSISRLNEGDNLLQMIGEHNSCVDFLFEFALLLKNVNMQLGENFHKVNDQLIVRILAISITSAQHSALSFVMTQVCVIHLTSICFCFDNSSFFLWYWCLKQGRVGLTCYNGCLSIYLHARADQEWEGYIRCLHRSLRWV